MRHRGGNDKTRRANPARLRDRGAAPNLRGSPAPEPPLPALLLQILALVLLIGGTALILRLTPAGAGPQRSRRVIALTTAGGLTGAPFWWAGAPASFAWELAPLAFRFLGAAGLAFGALGLAVLIRPSPARVRLHLGMLALYLAPVVAAVLTSDRGRLDWGAPIAWAFALIALGLLAAAVLEMLRAPDLRPGVPPGPTARHLWSLLAGLLALWSLGLLLTPRGPLAALWLWPQDALTSRLIGAMLAALALAAWTARNRADLERPAGIVLASYGLGVLLAAGMQAAAGRPLPWAYALLLGLGGVFGLMRALQGRGARG